MPRSIDGPTDEGPTDVGWRLVREAMGIRPLYPQVSWDAWGVLLRMCIVAHDRHDVPTYFEGDKPLALALCYDVPDDGVPLSGTALRMVNKRRTELINAGLIKQVAPDPGVRRKTRTWAIMFALPPGHDHRLRPPDTGQWRPASDY